MTDKKKDEKKKGKTQSNWIETFLPKLKAGITVKVHQRIKEKNNKGGEKERIQIFEGIVLGHRGGKQKTATVTVRKIAAGGIGVERIFPIYSPNIVKMEITKIAKVRRAKLGYLRTYKKKLKEKKA